MSFQDKKPVKRAAAARDLGLVGPAAKAAIPNLVEVIGKETSDAVIINVVDALDGIGPDPKIATPALLAALKDPRFTQWKDVLAKIKEVYNRFK